MDRPTDKDKTSTVFFVGAGPGDPELITVKGMNLLEEADTVVYTGSLVKEKVLEYCRKDAELVSSASMDLEEIMAILVESSRKGKRVVRLHTGDPSLYSALREQTETLEEEKIPYEVVPGVSSAFAASASLKTELTAPEKTQTVIFTRLEGRTPVPERERLSELAKHRTTICIFLSAGMIERVVQELEEGGYPSDTPAAAVYRASWEDELVIRGTLMDISEKVKEAKITKHAVIIVGSAIGSEDAARKKSKLYDRDFKHGFRER